MHRAAPLTLLPLLLTVCGAPNDPPLASFSPEWVRGWGHEWDDVGWDVLVADDHLFVAGKIISGPEPRQFDAYLAKVDFDGNVVWERPWDNGHHDSAMVLETDGEFLYLGGFTSVDGVNHSLLQKRDFDGEVIWSRDWGGNMGDGGHHEVDGIAVVGDALYLSHWDAAWGLTQGNAVAKKFDKDGREQWSVVWGVLDAEQDHTDGHIFADETGVWITGRVGGSWPVSGGQAYLTKISPAGEQLWLREWGGALYDDGLNLESDGEHIYITGSTSSYGAGALDAFVLKYTLDGELVWELTSGGAGDEFARGCAIVGDSLFVALATKSWGAGDVDTVLARYDKRTGALLAQRIWGDAQLNSATASLVVHDGHGYLVGNNAPPGASATDGVYLKVDLAELGFALDAGVAGDAALGDATLDDDANAGADLSYRPAPLQQRSSCGCRGGDAGPLRAALLLLGGLAWRRGRR